VSSAILYVAIVAIWACVLIPRWLRRGASSASYEAVPGDAVPDETVADAPVADAPVVNEPETVPARGDSAERQDEIAAKAPAQDAPPPLTPQESRQRMLTARRRLLGMLLVLETAAIALAVLGLAALWVVIPPSVMLAGYMLLLREAAHADAERAERAERTERAARAERERQAAKARARAEERALARARAAQRPATPAPAPAAAPAAYEEAGRDFAPGLAGKYTTSNAADGISDQPGERYLRAVGD
jgi:hypothetical protein